MVGGMEVTGVENCGNSPKNALLAAWEHALAVGDATGVRAVLADDIELEHAGDSVRGIDAVAAALADLRGALTAAHIDMAVTHGREGATGGSWIRRSDSHHFAHLFRFANAKGTALSWIRVVETAGR